VARIKVPQVATYGSYSLGGDSLTSWQLRGTVGYGQPTISSTRLVTIGNNSGVASESHSAQLLSSSAEAEMTRDMGVYRLHAVFGLRASSLQESRYVETGSAANLDIAARDTQSLKSNIGGSFVIPTKFANTMFNVRAAWNHELAGTDPQLSARLADSNSPTRFTVMGTSFARDSMTVGAGFSGHIKRAFSFYGDYSLEARGGGQFDQTTQAGLRYSW